MWPWWVVSDDTYSRLNWCDPDDPWKLSWLFCTDLPLFGLSCASATDFDKDGDGDDEYVVDDGDDSDGIITSQFGIFRRKIVWELKHYQFCDMLETKV